MKPKQEADMIATKDEVDTLSPKRTWDIMKAIDIAMLVTNSPVGLRGRPMSTIPSEEQGLIYILTERYSAAADDVRTDGAVFLSYQASGDHVAAQGAAKIVDDLALVRHLWNPGAQVFWPDGPDGHDVVAIAIEPGRADVWDGHGILRSAYNVAKGLVAKQSPDLGKRATIDFKSAAQIG